MKKTIKRIFSLLTVIFILLFTLSISSFATSATSIQVNFGLHTKFYDTVVDDFEAVREAVNSLQIDYVDSNREFRTLNYNGVAQSFVTYGDFTVQITNPSYYEFHFTLVIPGGAVLIQDAVIKAATSSGPSMTEFVLGDYLDYYEATQVTFWFKTTMPPVWKGTYNTSYSIINYVSGDGVIHRTDKVFAPDKTVGSYMTDIQSLDEEGIIDPVPSFLGGYQLNSASLQQDIVISPDKINTYTISYSIKTNSSYAIIDFVSGDGVVLRSDTIYAPSNVVGSYTYLMQELVNDDIISRFPEYLGGYQIDWRSVPESITIDPDVVNKYTIQYPTKTNASYAILNAITPNGIIEDFARIYAPENYVGDYTYLTQYLLNEGLFASNLNGFSFVPSSSPTHITVYSDQVATYDLMFTDLASDKEVIIYYYDQYGKLIKPVTYYINSMAPDFKVPAITPYIPVPERVELVEGDMSETFNIYCFDFEAAANEAYELGKSAGLAISQKDLESQLNAKYHEGYDVGFKDGYDDGSVLTGKERNELMKNYNAITGLFDGWFNALLASIDIVFEGVAFGGVTLGSVIWTLVIIVVVVLVGGKLL